MTLLREAQQLTVTEAARRGVARLLADAEEGSDVVVTRHRRPVAVVVGIDRLVELEAALSDLHDLALVLARAADDTGRRTSLDDVLAAFGHTRASLRDAEDADEGDDD